MRKREAISKMQITFKDNASPGGIQTALENGKEALMAKKKEKKAKGKTKATKKAKTKGKKSKGKK